MTDLTPEQIKQAIKTEVANLGFLLSGFTTPDLVDSFSEYKKWINSGYHAEMQYLARESSLEKRHNPRLLMLDVKSILVLGIPYPAPEPTDSHRIAAYAQGPDYHNIIPNRLTGFKVWLEALVEHAVNLSIFTDTAPILEKPLAVRAGLGWIGKNGLLIHPEYGSYFFLTEIFMDLGLPPDQPFTKDLCGTCTKCIESCPTSAILPGHQIDSNRCLSYLTIEKKGPFTNQEEQFISKSIFGCDQCQLVCPWNQKRMIDRIIPTLFSMDGQWNSITSREFLAMSKEDFQNRFGYTPITRTKRFGLLRNVLANMANTGTEKELSLLNTFVEHEQNENLRMIAIHAQVEISKRLELKED